VRCAALTGHEAIDTRRTLYTNVVLSGGCTMLPDRLSLPGLLTRREKELRGVYLEHTLNAGPPPTPPFAGV
jgi:actin-related protein